MSKKAPSLGKIEASDFLSFDDQDLSNDGATVAPGGVPGPKENARSQKIIIEKYGEDEALGEFATQAMALYSNLNYPNLKNEFKGKLILIMKKKNPAI